MNKTKAKLAAGETVVGLFASTVEMSREWQHHGARYITTGTDGFLRNGMHEFLERVRA